MKKVRTVSPVRTRAARAGRQFPIVGVGASAGGLEAFTQLLRRLPADTGFGFVLVQHLDPLHASALTQLLARATTMPVREVTNNLRVLPNHVYIIPPDMSLGIAHGVLKLQPRSRERVAPRSIDFFFEALAKDQQERAIGVILSGSATDGTLGLEAIKAEGGLTFAQDASARYDSMPRSAATAGCVDFVLPPENIAKELARIAKHPFVAGRMPAPPSLLTGEDRLGAADDKSPLPARGRVSRPTVADSGPGSKLEASGYKKILLLLRNHCGVDFSLYKSPTIHRRITRRTVVNQRHTLEAYADFLRGNTKELDALYSDALINVTSFFRNADAFEVLRHKVFPQFLAQRDDDPVRIWVLGCSTGQEAYSLAMAFAEAAEKYPRARKLQVFATDLNDANLEKARHGLYTKGVVQDVSPERLRRFFVEEDGGYRIVKSLRERVVFARQNIISDPPFSRMDLISCRNLMIYLEPGLQKKIFPTFHYALKPGGFLFLGASESIGTFNHLFAPVNKKQKIFSRRTIAAAELHLPAKKVRATHASPGQTLRAAPVLDKKPGSAVDAYRGELSAEREADRVTVNQFAPPGVLIDADLRILQFRGPTGAYLEPPTGKATFDLLKMARDGLMLPLRAAINLAKRDNVTARKENVPLKQNGKMRAVNLEVVPLKNLKERCYLVLFEESKKSGHAALGSPPPEQSNGDAEAPPSSGKKNDSSRVAELERDLTEARDYLQSIQEQHEAASEELQAANEEGQSANEELQSLNEELETSKEELESTNEELTTVNEEMVNRNTELNRLNSDLTNLQTSAQLVILVLGRDLTIRRFSAQAEKFFSLLPTDAGRPFNGIRHNLRVAGLDALIGGVIANVRESEREVQDTAGRWYSLRVRPYLTLDNKVDGAVLVLVDIDELKRTERLIIEEHHHAEAIIRTVPNPLVILSSDLRVQSANDAFFHAFKLVPAEVKGSSIFQLDHGSWNFPRLRHFLGEVIPRENSFNDFAVTHRFARVGVRSLLLNARMLKEPGHKPKQILLGIQDVTEMAAFQTDLRRSELRFRRLFEAAQDGILILDPVTRKITDANPFIVRLLGYSRAQLIKKELWQIGLLKDEAANREAFRELKKKGFIRYEDLPLKAKGGARHEVEFVSNRYEEDGVEVIQCNVRDITERKRVEMASNRLAAIVEFSRDAIIGKDLNGIISSWNQGAERVFGYAAREMVGTSIRRLIPAGRQKEEDAILAKIKRGEAVQHFETRRRTKDKRLIDTSVTISPILDATGNVVGVSKVARDITERKQAEQALREARAELAKHAGQLESMVGIRTAQLTATNRRLETAIRFTRKSKEAFQALFEESQVMARRLRQLTHQILTAQEEERKKISRELHDEVVQTLVGINVELSALVHGNSVGVQFLKDKIARTQRLVEGSVEAVHRFARELRPTVLDDLGLIPALHAFSVSLAERKKFKIHLTASRRVEALSSDKRTVLFRVAQEALTNIARHARATHVKFTITEVPGAVRMEISDNGKAFAVKKIYLSKNNKRLGLVGMKERVEMVGGMLTIESVPGKGTTVRAEIPFSSSSRKK